MSSNKSKDSNSDTDSNKHKQISKMVLCKEVATTPISILIESLVKNLCTLIEKDDQRALKIYNKVCTKLFEMKLIDESYNMTEFEDMRGQYQRALYHLVTAARGTDEPLTLPKIWSSESFDTEFSQYCRQFEEIEFIAGGGFGQVFKVRHKLDGALYAVKKISIRANRIESIMEYLSEVKTFACLNHNNIVPYKAAWLELSVSNNKKAIELPDSTFSEITKENRVQSDSFRLEKHDSNFTVQFESSEQSSEISTRYSVSNPGYSTKFLTNSRKSVSEGDKAICKYNFSEQCHNFVLPKQNWATLYIQMSLCQITLKQWLDKRNQSEKDMDIIISLQSKSRCDTINDILCQILKGLEYIHSKGIAHHDIKPSNVFIQNDEGKLNVQLGDFGLACPLQIPRHSLAFGTKLYAAPEQLAGKCDRKSDMYSLGIILLELSDSYQTDMERVQHINELRHGRLPAHISAAAPALAAIISQLATSQPHLRPTAPELLTRLTAIHNVSSAGTLELQDLQNKLRESEATVERLKAMLKEKGVDFH